LKLAVDGKNSTEAFLLEWKRLDSARSLQEVLQAAKLRSKINKVGSIHMLRQNSIRTTMRYTHVTNKQISKIGSPLDKLDW